MKAAEFSAEIESEYRLTFQEKKRLETMVGDLIQWGEDPRE